MDGALVDQLSQGLPQGRSTGVEGIGPKLSVVPSSVRS